MQSYVPQSNRDKVGKTHSDKPMNTSNTVAYHLPHIIPILQLRTITIFLKVTNFFL